MGSTNRTSRIVNVLLGLMFLFGLCVMLYPFVSNWLYQNGADELTQTYEKTVEEGNTEEYDQAFTKAQAYNITLVGQTVPDVFAIREGTTDEEYESHLNIMGDLMMGYIEIPVINVNLPIYHYSTEDSLQKGCVHIFGSSLPVGGINSHAVITAHRALPAAEMFSELDQVREGDKFFLRILNRTLAYEVDRIEVVKPDDTRSLAISRGRDYVTLVTCTPYGVNTDRLLVRGHRVSYEEGDQETAKDTGIRLRKLLWTLAQFLAAALGVLVALIIVRVIRRRGRKRVKSRANAGQSHA